MANASQVKVEQPSKPARKGHAWTRPFLLGLGLLTIYSANSHDLGSYDTAPTSMMLLTLARGEGVYLDRFRSILHDASHALPIFVKPWRGHIVSRYPVAPALLVQPLVIPQLILTDWIHPGWDRSPKVGFSECKWFGRRSMALLMCLTAVLLYIFLVRLGLGAVALPATLAAALGSNLWSIGSQAMWQHGPAAFSLMVAISLLHPAPASRTRLVLAGFAAAVLFSCRLIDGLFLAVMILWLARSQPRGLFWFLPAPLIVAIILLNYNLAHFGEFEGGQAELEQLHRPLHHLPGPWSGNLVEGMTGTLLSPSRGLFIFSPWVLLAVLSVPMTWSKLRGSGLTGWLLLALIPYLLLFSKYAVWWGGHCFGPRYWTDVIPLLAILLAFGLDWASLKYRSMAWLFLVSIVLAIGVQFVGAFCFPSNWNLEPEDVDTHHERLWDWRDTELTRCLGDTWRRYRKQ
jgi:hypothetical protein